jgi:uncharacterized protein (DUF952 family)/lysophospholipase L1-like esterase
MSWNRYVALGDSQTEGLLDPDGRGGHRGWADRFADMVAASNPALEYANLAVRGRLIGQIADLQLAPAQAMAPDLVTVMGGLNDVLRPSFDLDAALGHLDALLAGFPEATVLTNTFPDISKIAPAIGRLLPRVQAYNTGIRSLAARHGALLVDFDERGTGTDLRIWSADRIHANALGHSIIAAAFADTLGLPGFTGWDTPLPAVTRGPVVRARDEARWVGGFVVPWLSRRIRGVSSGDGITAKRPVPLPVSPVFHLIDPLEWAVVTEQLRPPSLAAEGFVHLSFAHQVAGSANRHLPGASALVALEVDAVRAGAAVVLEDSYGSGTAFPHLYGPLPRAAVVAEHPVTRGADGRWAFSGSA